MRLLNIIQPIIERTRRMLIEMQDKETGRWIGEINYNLWDTAVYILTLKYLGKCKYYKDNINRAILALIRYQQNDGSWGIIDEPSPPELNVTLLSKLALELALEELVPINIRSRVLSSIKKAEDFLRRKGDIGKLLNTSEFFTQIIYALFGKFGWNDIDFPPMKLTDVLNLLFNISIGGKGLPGWVRATFPQVLYVYLKNINFSDLFKELSKKVILKYLKKIILLNQLPDGSWFTHLGDVFGTISLKIMGYEDSIHMRMVIDNLNKKLDKTGYVHGFRLPVWDTSLSLIALVESGLDQDHIAIARARKYILFAQGRRGGWAFNPYLSNKFPDCDDTALAIWALRKAGVNINEKCLQKGVRWLLKMQSRNGGWAAFEKNQSIKPPGAMPSYYEYPLIQLEDPPTADVTGHVLSALGQVGFTISDKPVKKATDFLRADQTECGAWWGRWGNCYIYGTCCVLMGLRAVKENMKKSYVKKAVEWLKSKQNEDGGWGESYNSYFRYEFAGEGESTPEHTAWAILSLLSAGEDPTSYTIQKGISYLVKTFNPERGWSSSLNAAAFEVGRYKIYSLVFPLMALSFFIRRHGGSNHEDR